MGGAGSRCRTSSPARLADQRAGGEVPRLDAALVVGVVAARRRSTRGRSRPSPMRRMSRTRGSRRAATSAWRGAHVGVVAEAGGDERGRRARSRARGRRAAGRRASAAAVARGRPQLVAHRVVDDAGERALLVLDRDRDAPLRDAEQEVRRAVERVDDPAQPAACRACREPSSPSMPSSGPRARAARSRISFSAATSASETRSVGLLFVSIRSVGRRTPRAAARPPRGRSARRARAARSSRRHAGRPTARAASICAASESERRLVVGAADELDGEREAVGA